MKRHKQKWPCGMMSTRAAYDIVCFHVTLLKCDKTALHVLEMKTRH